jgi:hypothetical protein
VGAHWRLSFGLRYRPTRIAPGNRLVLQTNGPKELGRLVRAFCTTRSSPHYAGAVLDDGHDMLTLRHTATTRCCSGTSRGKRLVVLVGQKKAVAITVRNVSGRRRWSKLAEWLRLGPLASRIGCRVDLWWQRIFCRICKCDSGLMGRSGL